MAAWDEESSGCAYLGIAMFTGAEKPTGVAEEGICGTFFFSENLAKK
jgi:phage-related protein